MIRNTLLAFMFLLMGFNTIAQYKYKRYKPVNISSEKGQAFAGFGLGISYAKTGIRMSYNVIDRLTVYGSGGYHRAGLCYNVGLIKDFSPFGNLQPYLVGSYGNNAAISMIGTGKYRERFTGPSFGGGIKINTPSWPGNYVDIGVMYALTSTAYQDNFDAAKEQFGDRLKDPWPVSITIGYNFKL